MQKANEMRDRPINEFAENYMEKLFYFCLKKTGSQIEAEDLTQDIALQIITALNKGTILTSFSAWVWQIARNRYSVWAKAKHSRNESVPGSDIGDYEIEDESESILDEMIHTEQKALLRRELAFIKSDYRNIVVAYYIENKNVREIAESLSLPTNTVKSRLLRAREILKEGMDTMRKTSELKFNPIKFDLCGFSGSVGTKGSPAKFFDSLIAQNIEYAVLKEAKTVNEIAEELGVSPVYVENEVERLEEYGLLTKIGDKYLCNILLEESTTELNHLHDQMYLKVADIFANELFDELINSGILDDGRIWGGTTEPFSFTYDPPKDKNFMLWALIPYIAAMSGSELMDESTTFEEAATTRPDGGENICYASIIPHDVASPLYFDSMKRFCGPCWNGFGEKFKVWTIDSEWSKKRVDEDYQRTIYHDLSLLNIYLNGDTLSPEGYAYLCERGYISALTRERGLLSDVSAGFGDSFISSEDLGDYKIKFRCLCLSDAEINRQLIEIGDHIKEKHRTEFDNLKKEYVDAVLKETPKQLQTMKKYGLQYTFYSDGWFILHCIKTLIANGKLKEPTDDQKKSLTTIIIQE